MNDLEKLAVKYGTDKYGKHHYTDVYYDLFKDKRETVKKVLEIGIAEGASLKMWRDFFPNALIYGADNDKERVENLQGEDQIYVFKCDQSKENDLLNMLDDILPGPNDLDLIVDDGSHKPEDQISTCLTLLKTNALRYGNTLYVIEDVADENVARELIKGLPGFYVNVKKVGKRYDDRLLIVGKING